MVQINFRWGKDANGSLYSVPFVPIDTFRLSRQDGHAVVYKPTVATLWKSLGVTLVMAVLMGILYFTAGPVLSLAETDSPGGEFSQPMRQTQEELKELQNEWVRNGVITQEDVDRHQAESEARQRAHREATDKRRNAVQVYIAPIFWAAMSLLGTFALLAPLSTLWRTVRISHGVNLRPKVSWISMLGWPSTHTFDKDSLTTADIVAQEEQVKINKSQWRTAGWRWRITVYGRGGEPRVIFQCMRQAHRPMEDRWLPPSVAQLTDALEGLWGITCNREYVILDLAETERGMFRRKRVFESAPRIHRSETVRKYASIDDMPPELQAKARAMVEEARRTGRPVQSAVSERSVTIGGDRSITFRQADGTERTYGSIDDMPPDVRADYEKLMRMLGEK